MRKVSLVILLLLLVTFVSFVACNKEEPLRYSCDERAQEYAVMSQEDNQDISRDNLVKLERAFQFAVFRSLSPVNKKRIFNEKIDLLLATLTLTPAERAHLETLKSYNNPAIYEDEDGEFLDPVLVSWESTAKMQLGWTDEMIQGMVGTWATPEEITMIAGRNPLRAKSDDCSCNYDIGCAGFGDCKSGGCKKTPNGCGLLAQNPCKCNCPEDRIGPSTPGNGLNNEVISQP